VVVQTIDFGTMDELQSVELKRSAIRATGASHEICWNQCSHQKDIFHLQFEFKIYLARLKTQWCRLKHCFHLQFDVAIFSSKGTLLILKPSHQSITTHTTAHHIEKITSHIEIIK
jgi:hypothetical protein